MKYFVADIIITAEDPIMQVARDLVADAAGEAGFEAFEDTPNGLKAYVQDDLLNKQQFDINLAELPLKDIFVSYEIHPVEDKDWNQEWEQVGFDPINIANKIVIFDARKGLQQSVSGTTPIYIRARQAFGTGTHFTTQMMITALLSMDVKGKRVLDCGCGTGILGIAASKLEAREIVAYDIDEWSVNNTDYNAESNNVSNLQVLHGDVHVLSHVCGLFDIVVANINRNILLNDMVAFKDVMAAESTLILSGFYENDAPLLLKEANRLGLYEVEKQTEEDWCRLTLKAL